MAKSKFMQHFCAYCHKETKMELVGGVQSNGIDQPEKVWYRCTRCKHSALLDRSQTTKQKNGALLQIDRRSFIEYAKEKTFNVGQTIFHTEWNDFGTVTSKRKISSGTSSIMVSFEKSGERKLLENVSADFEQA